MQDNDEETVNEFSPEQDSPPEWEIKNPFSNYLPDDDSSDSDNGSKPEEESKSADASDTDVSEVSLPDFMDAVGGNGRAVENEKNEQKPSYQKREYETEDYGKINNENFSQNDNHHLNNDSSVPDFLQNSSENRQTTDSDGANASSQNDSDGSEDNGDSSVGNTSDREEEIGFKKKMSASDADRNPKAKPKVLNKKLLLSTLIILFGGAMLVTFLAPTGKKVKSRNEKPVAENKKLADYSSLAKRPEETESVTHYTDVNVNETPKADDEEVEIPPVIVKNEKEPYTPNNISTASGSGSGSSIVIPDTRNDSLQSKQISGIKGLSSTQQSYSTDYQQTIAKNTSTASLSSGYSLPSKEEYMNSVMSAYSSTYGNNNSYANQNDQDGKSKFFNNGRQGENVGQGEYLALNTLWQGTIFEAVLTSEMNTDLPGEITARIVKNIYSSQNGRYLLIPQNSIVYGTYNSSISYSQSRVQVAWHTLIRPDGYQIQLGNMNGTDAKGASGLKGTVNDHPMAYLKAIGLMSVFSIVNAEFQSGMGNTQNQYLQNVLANSQQVTNELGDKLIDRAMNVQPTIKIKSGTKINIVVNQNLSLPPCDDIEVTQPYHKY